MKEYFPRRRFRADYLDPQSRRYLRSRIVMHRVDVALYLDQPKPCLVLVRTPPRQKWWFVGDLVRAAEKYEDAALRTLKETIGLTVRRKDLKSITPIRQVYSDSEIPRELGHDNYSVMFACRITQAQLKRAKKYLAHAGSTDLCGFPRDKLSNMLSSHVLDQSVFDVYSEAVHSEDLGTDGWRNGQRGIRSSYLPLD